MITAAMIPGLLVACLVLTLITVALVIWDQGAARRHQCRLDAIAAAACKHAAERQAVHG